MSDNNNEIAILGAGCFWCIEAIFQQLKGVQSVTSGYSGGHIKNPAYREVCNGSTGHAEVAKIVFDPQVITFTYKPKIELCTKSKSNCAIKTQI